MMDILTPSYAAEQGQRKRQTSLKHAHVDYRTRITNLRLA